MPHVNGLYFSRGNSKVRFPIFNVGPGIDCASRKWCGFDGENYKAAGHRRCYAQKIELLRPSVLKSRRKNAAIIAGLKDYQIDLVAHALAAALAKLLKGKRKADRIVRLNESGDLSRTNIAFVCALIRQLKVLNVATYLYSKAPPILRRLAAEAGAEVLHSEHDFVAVSSIAEGEATGLNPCPGVCGPCKACPSGVKSWILEH